MVLSLRSDLFKKILRYRTTILFKKRKVMQRHWLITAHLTYQNIWDQKSSRIINEVTKYFKSMPSSSLFKFFARPGKWCVNHVYNICTQFHPHKASHNCSRVSVVPAQATFRSFPVIETRHLWPLIHFNNLKK